MEGNKKGGKRLGAGRKPVLHKKKQISLYVEGNKILPFGNEEKMKVELYGFIDNKHLTFSVQDLNKPTNEIKPIEQPKSNYSINTVPKQTNPIVSRYNDYKELILATTMKKELEGVMAIVKSDEFLTVGEKRNLDGIATNHSREFYND